MNYEPLTSTELTEFKKYFGTSLEEILLDDFKKIHKQLQSKYHPDNFEKHDDATIREMAVEKFQYLEFLCNKAKNYIDNKFINSTNSTDAPNIFGYNCPIFI